MSDAKIISLTPIEEVFSITWNLHKRCNNDCMYCGDFLHDQVSPVSSLETLQGHWQQIFEKTKHIGRLYKISFTGGEPVINKNFMPFVRWLASNYSQYLNSLRLTSNGTASKNYYLEIFRDLTSLTLSTHTESLDVERFIDTAIACNQYSKSVPSKIFMVNIMEEYWALDTIKYLIDTFKANDIKFSVSKINYTRNGARNYPVFIVNKQKTHKQDLAISSEFVNNTHQAIQDYLNLNKIPEDTFYNVKVTYENNNDINTYAARLNFLGLNKFKNWQCYAGLHRINISSTGEVFSGECYNESLGYLTDNSFALRTSPGTCKLETCTNNPDDIMIKKQAPTGNI